MTAFSTNIPLIFISRILDGIFGGQAPIIKAYFADFTTIKERKQKMGQLFFGVSLAIIIGPALGGFLGSITILIPCLLAALRTLLSAVFEGRFSAPRAIVRSICRMIDSGMGSSRRSVNTD